MRAIILTLLLAAGAAAADTIPVRWVRGDHFPQFEVRDGACVIYAPDTAKMMQADRVPLESLVRGCIERGGLRQGAGDFDLTWTHAASESKLHEAFMEEHGRAAPAPTSLLKPGRNAARNVMGFSRKIGRDCMVWTVEGYPSLGHELKHCYEGGWHR
jgi:hypothetical protein